MSLINDVLRDLAKREPQATGTLSGIRVVSESGRRSRVRRLSALLSGIFIALLVLGTGWFLLTRERKPHLALPPPHSLGTTDHAAIQTQSPVPPAAVPAQRAVATTQRLLHSAASGGRSRRFVSRTIRTKPQVRPALHRPHPPVAIAQSLDIRSASPTTPAEEVQLDLLEARRDLRHRKVHRAMLRFRAALSLEPRNSTVRLALGGLEMRLGDLPAARALLLAGIRLPGTSSRARDAQINLLARTGNTALAWHEIRRHPPDNPATHLHFLKLAAALAQLTAHWSAAARLYGEIIAKRPGAAWAWAGRGIALEQSGRARLALASDRQALVLGGLAPTLAFYLERRIRFLEKTLPTHEPPTR